MSLLQRVQIFFDKIESYLVSYNPLRILMYDAVKVTTKFNLFKRVRRTATSFGG